VTVSVLDAGARRFRCQTDNQGLFPHLCAKAGNGFIARENCFVARVGRNNCLKSSMTSVTYRLMEPGFGGIPSNHQPGPEIEYPLPVNVVHWRRRGRSPAHRGRPRRPVGSKPVRLFNLFLMSPGQAHDREPKHRRGLPNQTTCSFSGQLALDLTSTKDSSRGP
jgi:hypothetical protein